MGCASSKILTRTASIKEEFQRKLRRRQTENFEEIVIPSKGAKQLVAVLRSSKPSTVASKHKEIESPKEEFKETVLDEISVEKLEEQRNEIETINVWDLLAGLDDDNEAEAEAEVKEESFEDMNSVKTACGKSELRGGKGMKRKIMAKDLARMKVPAFEFSRTGSLRDWLAQGEHVFSPGSHVTPRFGSFDPQAGGGGRAGKENDFFDPKLVSQLEEDMKEMTMEEEEMLRQIEARKV